MESEGSRRQNAGPTNRHHIEAYMLDEESIISKVQIYPESMFVDVAGISGKVSAHYPGRSALCLHSSYPRRMERTESRRETGCPQCRSQQRAK